MMYALLWFDGVSCVVVKRRVLTATQAMCIAFHDDMCFFTFAVRFFYKKRVSSAKKTQEN